MMKEKKFYLKDVFDIDEYLAMGKKKFFIISGVCSGKSMWVREVLSSKGSVLFVTSRKAKAEADIRNSSFSDVIKWNTVGNQTLITNAGLAKRIENIALNNQKEMEEFVNHFDYIVIDEVHSVVTDSLFAESSFSVLSFIEYVAKMGKIIICMTGTPEPIKDYFIENEWLILDFLDKCNYVHPKHIMITFKHEVLKLMKRNCKTNPIIYFSNRTNTIIQYCKELIETNILDASEIAVLVSKSREKEIFESIKKSLSQSKLDEIKECSEKVYEMITNSGKIPEQCKILFSTSALKEGVDIKNEKTIMFCENHVQSNLIQFFGRARNENNIVYIIADSVDHKLTNNKVLYTYAVEKEVDAVNEFYKTCIDTDRNPFSVLECRELAEHVTDNPYIYFDYIENEFKVFHLKYNEEIRLKNNLKWKQKLWEHCKKYDIQEHDFTYKSFYVDALIRLAKKGIKYFEKEQKESILNFIYSAYRIDAKQPETINELLKRENACIRIEHVKENRKPYRGKTYWKLVLVEEIKNYAS